MLLKMVLDNKTCYGAGFENQKCRLIYQFYVMVLRSSYIQVCEGILVSFCPFLFYEICLCIWYRYVLSLIWGVFEFWVWVDSGSLTGLKLSVVIKKLSMVLDLE